MATIKFSGGEDINFSLTKRLIKSNTKAANEAASLAVNKTVTFAIKETIADMTTKVNLQSGYIGKHVHKGVRASPNRIRASVFTNTRNTLLTRYPIIKTKSGIKVAINASGGYREIPTAFIARTLKGSGVSGIAMRNTEALKLFEKRLGRGLATNGKQAKLNKLRKNAAARPRGITVLSSRSINQIFTTSRVDITPMIKNFLSKEFIKDLRRLSI